MIESIMLSFILIKMFVNLCWSPRQLKIISHVLKLSYGVASIIRHCWKKKLIIKRIILFDKSSQIGKETITNIEYLTP